MHKASRRISQTFKGSRIMTNELIVPEQIDYSDTSMIQTLKTTVAQGLTDPEFRLFVEYCKATGLNPLRRDLWAIKVGGRLQLMTSAQGFFTIANSNAQFDGYESGLVGPNGEMATAAYPKNDFIGAWCRVHRKDRKVPTEAVAMMDEYAKPQGNWKSMPRVMITKCAESLALRKTFPQQLGGLYTQEEMPTQYAAAQSPSALPEPKVKPSIEPKKEEVDNEKQRATRLLIANGLETYQYDLHGIGNTCAHKKDKAQLWAEIKALGGIAVDKLLYSAEELPDFESFEISRPGSQLQVEVDDISFEKESEELEREK